MKNQTSELLIVPPASVGMAHAAEPKTTPVWPQG